MTRMLPIFGWILVAVDLVTSASLLLGRKSGDAATSALGPGIGALLAGLGLAAAALLFWAGRAEGRLMIVVVACVITAAPVALALGIAVSPRSILGLIYPSMRERARPMMPSPQYAYPDAAGRAAALALVMGDFAKLDTVLRAKPSPDLTAHDESGESLLGLATNVALASGGSARELEGLRLILTAGAHPRWDDLGPEKSLIEVVAQVPDERSGVVLKMLLDAGLVADAPMRDGHSLLFASDLTADAARILLAHGANPNVHESFGDKGDWSPVTYHADRQRWETALALFNGGVPRDHDVPVGSAFARVMKNGEEQATDADRKNSAFQSLLAAARR